RRGRARRRVARRARPVARAGRRRAVRCTARPVRCTARRGRGPARYMREMDVRRAAASPAHGVAALRAADPADGRDTHESVAPAWIRRQLVLFAIWSIPGLIQTSSMYAVYAAEDPGSI